MAEKEEGEERCHEKRSEKERIGKERRKGNRRRRRGDQVGTGKERGREGTETPEIMYLTTQPASCWLVHLQDSTIIHAH